MVRPDLGERWPATWKKTRAKAEGIIEGLQREVAARPLEADELAELKSVISHLHGGSWRRSWRNPVIAAGARVAREHFSQVFQLEPTSKPRRQLNRILERTLPTDYFEERPFNDPEVAVLAQLVCYHNAVRRHRIELDFTGLVNTA